ncbi:MAG: YcnI family copper-binding membrane protein [Janibacter sp.]
MNRSTHLTLRSTAALAIAAGGVAIGVQPASAHVTVHADATASGGYAALTFRVPNESDSASTDKLVVTLPQDTPIASVSTRPVPGWTAKVTTKKLPEPVKTKDLNLTEAPRTITWTADDEDAAIAPGEYEEFSISGGPLPEPGTLVLPAEQTYTDGEVVDWADEPTGGEEPEHPAPVVEVTEAQDGAHGAAAAGGEEDEKVTATAGSSADDSSDTPARVLGGLALVVAVVGAGIAVVTGRRRSA